MNENRVHQVLRHLANHGWITLRSMAPLLGYKHAQSVYGRQKGKNPIPTVLVGGTYRVYAGDVVDTLKNVPEEDQVAAKTFLRIYHALLKEQSNE